MTESLGLKALQVVLEHWLVPQLGWKMDDMLMKKEDIQQIIIEQRMENLSERERNALQYKLETRFTEHIHFVDNEYVNQLASKFADDVRSQDGLITQSLQQVILSSDVVYLIVTISQQGPNVRCISRTNVLGGLVRCYEERFWRPLARMYQYQSTSMTEEFIEHYLYLHGLMVTIVQRVGAKYAKRTSIIVYQVYIWQHLVKTLDLIELALFSFAMAPMILNTLCTKSLVDAEAILESMWHVPDVKLMDTRTMTRQEYRVMFHLASKSYRELLEMSSLMPIYQLVDEFLESCRERYLTLLKPAMAKMIKPDTDRKIATHLHRILEELWQFKARIIKHNGVSAKWYLLRDPLNVENILTTKDGTLNWSKEDLQLLRIKGSLYDDLHFIYQAIDNDKDTDKHMAVHWQWLSAVNLAKYKTLLTAPFVEKARFIVVIDRYHSIFYQILGVQIHRHKHPGPSRMMNTQCLLRQWLYDECLGMIKEMHTVFSNWFEVIYSELPQHATHKLDPALVDNVLLWSHDILDVVTSSYNHQMSMMSRILQDNELQPQPLTSYMYDGPVLSYYTMTNKLPHKLEHMQAYYHTIVLRCVGQILREYVNDLDLGLVFGYMSSVMNRIRSATHDLHDKDSEEVMMRQILAIYFVNGLQTIANILETGEENCLEQVSTHIRSHVSDTIVVYRKQWLPVYRTIHHTSDPPNMKDIITEKLFRAKLLYLSIMGIARTGMEMEPLGNADELADSTVWPAFTTVFTVLEDVLALNEYDIEIEGCLMMHVIWLEKWFELSMLYNDALTYAQCLHSDDGGSVDRLLVVVKDIFSPGMELFGGDMNIFDQERIEKWRDSDSDKLALLQEVYRTISINRNIEEWVADIEKIISTAIQRWKEELERLSISVVFSNNQFNSYMKFSVWNIM